MKGSSVPKPVLLHWYVCGRKALLTTETIAHLYKQEHQTAYRCPYGDHWHVGRPHQGPVTMNRKFVLNARAEWNRSAYTERPSSAELFSARLAAQQSR